MEAGFQSDIIDNPLDPVPRLIYADWLEERGQVERAGRLRFTAFLRQTQERNDGSYDLLRRHFRLHQPPRLFRVVACWAFAVVVSKVTPAIRDSQALPEKCPGCRDMLQRGISLASRSELVVLGLLDGQTLLPGRKTIWDHLRGELNALKPTHYETLLPLHSAGIATLTHAAWQLSHRPRRSASAAAACNLLWSCVVYFWHADIADACMSRFLGRAFHLLKQQTAPHDQWTEEDDK